MNELSTIQAVEAGAISRIPSSPGGSEACASSGGSPAFRATLESMVQDIDRLQQQVGASLGSLNEREADLPGLIQNADNAFEMMMGVKSRLLTAYQTLARKTGP